MRRFGSTRASSSRSSRSSRSSSFVRCWKGEIAALAAKRRSKEQLAAIRSALQRIDSEVAAGSDGVDADIAFHRSIAEATNNPHFLALIEFLFKFLRTATQTTRGIEATRAALTQQVKDEHRAIVDAVALQDGAAAREAARLHMKRASRRLGSADPKVLADVTVAEVTPPQRLTPRPCRAQAKKKPRAVARFSCGSEAAYLSLVSL